MFEKKIVVPVEFTGVKQALFHIGGNVEKWMEYEFGVVGIDGDTEATIWREYKKEILGMLRKWGSGEKYRFTEKVDVGLGKYVISILIGEEEKEKNGMVYLWLDWLELGEWYWLELGEGYWLGEEEAGVGIREFESDKLLGYLTIAKKS